MKTIDGIQKNLSSRSYCLSCSPFGKRNTRKIENEVKDRNWKHKGPCSVCNSTIKKKVPRSSICYSCQNKKNEKKKGDRLYGLVGEQCWHCDYGKGRYMLDFHHMHDKKFGLTIRNIGQFSWERTWGEAQKCVLLCCRCHREAHAGLLSEKYIQRLYEEKWDKIRR
jgi:hypothetical protein